ncbi:MAG: hypothetical protein K2X48_17180 [Chitinophagaceae bacterium]|nr:hypothetical protein [Chitinophagaceae bacterium]
MNNLVKLYQQKAYERFGIKEEDWQPQLGYKANAEILNQLYYYYRQVYEQRSDKFLWMGLARLTGGQVMYGMRNIIKIAKDPCVLTVEIMQMAKDIFDDIAWQHELFLNNPEQLIEVCKWLDATKPAQHSFEKIWKMILLDNPQSISTANQMLLENEQFNTIQHRYEIIRKDAYSKKYLWFTRFVMRNIHPYHNRFFFDLPFRDVTEFKYRWQWISHKKGMWNTWSGLKEQERSRLVSLNNEEVIAHHWN